MPAPSSMWANRKRERRIPETGDWGKMEVLCAFQLYFPHEFNSVHFNITSCISFPSIDQVLIHWPRSCLWSQSVIWYLTPSCWWTKQDKAPLIHAVLAYLTLLDVCALARICMYVCVHVCSPISNVTNMVSRALGSRYNTHTVVTESLLCFSAVWSDKVAAEDSKERKWTYFSSPQAVHTELSRACDAQAIRAGLMGECQRRPVCRGDITDDNLRWESRRVMRTCRGRHTGQFGWLMCFLLLVTL